MLDKDFLLHAYRLMYSIKLMADTYEANRGICRYVHATSRGHEAIQLATAFHLKHFDWVSPYYRDAIMTRIAFLLMPCKVKCNFHIP